LRADPAGANVAQQPKRVVGESWPLPPTAPSAMDLATDQQTLPDDAGERESASPPHFADDGIDDSHAALYGLESDAGALPCLSSATFVRSQWPAPASLEDTLGLLPEPAPLLDECLRRTLLNGERERWRSRAEEKWRQVEAPRCGHANPDCTGCLDCNPNAPAQYDYASRRVGALGRDISPKLYGCGKTAFPIACGCSSSRAWGHYSCRQWFLCRACRVLRKRKIAGKVEVALEQRVADERARAAHGAFGYGGFRSKVQIVLVTLSVKHSGDIAGDRARISEGWRNIRKRYHEEWGRFPSVLVWEVTPGDDLLGHVHAHVACVWPWRDWKRIGRWWYSATHDGRDPGAGERTSRINFSMGYREKLQPRNTPKKPASPRSMARYLAKYIGKGVDSSDFDAMLTARVSACFYGQRSIVTSHRFWLPRVKECPCCGQEVRRVATEAEKRMREWWEEPSRVPLWDANAPPDELLDALERGEIRGFVHLC